MINTLTFVSWVKIMEYEEKKTEEEEKQFQPSQSDKKK